MRFAVVSVLCLTRRCSVALASALSHGRFVDAAFGAGAQDLVAHADHATVDGAGHTVEHLHVQFGQHKGLVHTGLPQVSLRRGVHHVSHLEALDGLVLGHAAAAVGAADNGSVAAAVLGAAVVASFGWHGEAQGQGALVTGGN